MSARTQLSLEETLNLIKTSPVKTGTECAEALTLIESIHSELDPTAVLMLQMGVITKHYNLNKKPGDDEMTVVDAVLLGIKSRGTYME